MGFPSVPRRQTAQELPVPTDLPSPTEEGVRKAMGKAHFADLQMVGFSTADRAVSELMEGHILYR